MLEFSYIFPFDSPADVEELIADIESEIDARKRIAQVFYGKETNEKIISLIAERDALLQKKKDLTEKVHATLILIKIILTYRRSHSELHLFSLSHSTGR